MHSHKNYISLIKTFIPPLKESMHKGQSGKIAIIGGCAEYTGAPYYAAMSALKTGVDISHIFCTEGAGVPIKSYSPELIVHPVWKEKTSEKADMESITKWLSGLNALVIGPGLGRDPHLWEDIKTFLKAVKDKEIPVVIDGDGLNMVCAQPDIIKGYEYAILTPNVVEFKRLCKAVLPDVKEDEVSVSQLASKLGNVTIIQKGKDDLISNGKADAKCEQEGSPRRCGGQGDLLAGALVAFVSWGIIKTKSEEMKNNTEFHKQWPVLACYAACTLCRHSAKLAFADHKRSTTTPDMIAKIGPAFEELFDNDN